MRQTDEEKNDAQVCSLVCGDSECLYHMTCDMADALNYNYMANIARAVGRAASVLLEPVASAS